MGLLDRARVLDETPGFAGGRDCLAEAERILSGLKLAPEQLDYPVEVFSAYRSILGFSRGALMFPDAEKGEYYPWISVGVDRTTARRLRIPMNFPPLFNRENGDLVEVAGDELAPMLSNRESGLAGPIHVCPLGGAEKTDSLVLALDGVLPSADALQKPLRRLNDALGGGIAESRRLLEDVGTDDPVNPRDWLDAWGDRDAWLVTLDATGVIDALMEAIEGLEVYRARRDVIGLLRRINGRMGRTYDLKDGRVLILFPADRMPDRELYLHQLSASFCASVHRVREIPEFPVDFKRWPEEKDAVKSSLAGFFGE